VDHDVTKWERMPPSSPRPSFAATASVPAATIGANVASYALLLAAAHQLSKSDYGQLSSLLGLLLIGSVPQLALQTVTARRSASREGSHGIAGGAALVTVVATALFFAAAAPMAAFLHLGVSGPMIVAATVPGLAFLGAAQGLAQGRREFGRLSILIVATTGGRSVGGLVGLFAGGTVLTTLLGVFAGTTGAALVVAVRERYGRRGWAHSRVREVAIEAAHAAQAHGGFLLLTSIDVLLARHVLDGDSAGLYAVGSVVTRAALWLPQSVVTVMFASLAESDNHGQAARRTTAIVGAIGALAVVGAAVTSPILVIAVGGSKYRSLNDYVWLFALLGALLAIVQLSVLAGLAQRRVRRTILVWLTIVADVVVVLSLGDGQTPRGIITVLVIVAAVASALAVWPLLRRRGETVRPDPAVINN
jgi:O-antigen/teichoic acid export membrane protein